MPTGMKRLPGIAATRVITEMMHSAVREQKRIDSVLAGGYLDRAIRHGLEFLVTRGYTRNSCSVQVAPSLFVQISVELGPVDIRNW